MARQSYTEQGLAHEGSDVFSTSAFQLRPIAPFVIVRFQSMNDGLGRTEWFWYVVDSRGLEFGDRGLDRTEVLTSFAASTGQRLREVDIPLHLDRRDQRMVLAGTN